MIIYAAKPGQLGNSLIIYSTFIAFGLEHQLAFYNPGFYRYTHYFAYTSSKKYNRLSYLSINLLARIMNRAGFKNTKALDWKESIDLDEPMPFRKKTDLLFLLGWGYRGNKTLTKHTEQIKNIFTPDLPFKIKLDNFWNEHFKNNNDLIIGLHIRRGDYAGFENGKYFYSTGQYSLILEKMTQLFPDSQINFLISSNEKVDLQALNKINAKITLAPGHELLDMYALARCNYIIGPPSTYTMWASFYGNVPLCMVHDISKPLSINDFKVQNSF